jgi:tape measure domain-containing protein
VSVVANVAINVDSSGAVSKLRQVQQGAQATSQAVGKLNATTKAAGAASAGAASQFQAAANGMRAQQKAAGSLLGSISRLASAYLSLRVAQQAVQAGIKREESERRLTFLAQGYNEVARAQILASQSGKRFGLSATESNQQFAQLYGRLRPLNISIEDINAAFIGFNTAAKVSGTSTAETAGALLQLTQALGSGVLRGQELNSVLEQAPGLVVALTKELGVPVSTLRKLAEEGKITSDVVINALKRAGIEGAGQLEAALKGPAQSVKNLQNSFEDFQIGLTNDVIPAVVELLKGITSILGAFNKLPGPVKTITAAALGLTAAFVALAPAISATIGLLGGLSLATLAAAGPWIALAAGVTAAAVALAGYRSESQKVGGAARGGDASNVAAASKLLAQKDAQIAGLQGQRQTASGRQRASIDRNLAVLRRERAQLQSDVKAGTAATPAATAGNAMGTPVGATVGGGSGAGNAAKKAADEAKRLAEELQRSVERGDDLFRQFSRQAVLLGTASETERKRLQIQYDYQDRVREINELKNAEQKVNLMAVNDEIRRLQTLELQTEELKKQLELFYELAGLSMGGMLPGGAGAFRTDINLDPSDRAQQKIDEYKTKLAELQDPINMAQRGAQGIGDAFSSSFQGIITGTQTAQEALASFFQNIAKSFLDMATEIIAQMVIMYAFKQLLGLFGGGGSGIGAVGNFSGAFSGTASSFNPASFGMGLLPGRANGGPVSSGQTYMVGERGPELFVPGRSGTIVANDKMGGGSTNVVVNVDAKGSSVEGNEQGANQLGRVISAAVQSELIKQQRPGGLLAR